MSYLKTFQYLLLSFVLLGSSLTSLAQTSAFSYQGRLQDGGTPANGSYDFQFQLFDASSGGNQVGSTQLRNGVAVTGGIFTVSLDFGPGAFPGADRFLEIGVRLAGGGSFVVLSPRQPIISTPYALRSASANTADIATNATQLGGVAANQYVVTTDTRLSDSRPPTPGSSNYIQNSSSPQASSNFNISGNGTAAGTLSGNAVNSTTKYNIGGSTFLATGSGSGVFANSNTFTGFFAGTATTPDPGVGQNGNFNSFFGNGAGQTNSTGHGNSFFGNLAGQLNVTGANNSFFGFQAGNRNTGANNAYFGFNAGFNNTTANDNAYFGTNAGASQTGNSNTFVGGHSGEFSNGDNNTFLGFQAGGNRPGTNNTVIGASALIGTDNLSNATAIGAGAVVNQSNSIVLGSFNPVTNVGIGTTTPSARLDVAGNVNLTGTLNFSGQQILSNAGSQNLFAGIGAGPTNTGTNNAFFGFEAGFSNTSGSNNAFFGRLAGVSNLGGNLDSFFGSQAGVQNTSGNNNSFFGRNAGASNTTNSFNAYFGTNAGTNSDACCNSMFGNAAGIGNLTGQNNSFFGNVAGATNQTGSSNTAIGANADFGSSGLTNATAIGYKAMASQDNSLILGSILGVNASGSSTNIGIGTTRPLTRFHVVGDTTLGGNVGIGTAPSGPLTVVHAINGQGLVATVSGSATLTGTGTQFLSLFHVGDIVTVSGETARTITSIASDTSLTVSAGFSGTANGLTYALTGDTLMVVKDTGNVGIGTNNPSQLLHLFRPGSTSNLISFGDDEWHIGNTNTGDFNIFRGGTQQIYITNTGNVGIGTSSPVYRLNVNQTTPNTFAASVQTTGLATGNSYGLVVSAGTDVTDSAMQIRDQAGNPIMRVRGDGTVGIGTTNPLSRLHVVGDTIFTGNTNTSGNANVSGGLTVGGTVSITGQLNVHTMVTVGTSQVCINGDLFTRCSSSSLRYKTNVGSFQRGLEVVNNLHPITFTWKADGKSDFGLGAEDVEKVAPELVFYRDGQVEGVKYDRIGVVLINAVKEQQAQILKQQEQIKRQENQIARGQDQARQERAMLNAQQLQIDALKKLVCRTHRRNAMCK